MPTPADTHTSCDDYYCARRDRNGDVRLYCGRGPMVAMAHHTWFDVKEMHDTARSKKGQSAVRGGPKTARLRDMSAAQRVVDALTDTQLTYITEDDLQHELFTALAAAGIESTREVRLSDGRSRIDLMADRVGIEVKTNGGRADVLRQLLRYSHCPEIDALVLVTTRARHHQMPAEIGGKPLYLVSLIGSAL